MKKTRYILTVMLIPLVMIACNNSNKLSVQEELDLGLRFINEANYQEAIIYLSNVLNMDPKNIEAYKAISVAYQNTGKGEDAAKAMLTVILEGIYSQEDIDRLNLFLREMDDLESAEILGQMAYTQTGNDEFIKTLLLLTMKNDNLPAFERIVKDVEFRKGMENAYLQDTIQYLVDESDIEKMMELAGVLESLESKESVSVSILALNIWANYSSNGVDGVTELLELYYVEERTLPNVAEDEEIYIGEYDENGLRGGFGICFYGSNKKKHSRIYVGYWNTGDRNGVGRAYLRASYRIQSQWIDDYPAGNVDILQNNVTVLGTLAEGHVTTPMNLYEDGDWIAVHCTPDETQTTGFSFRTIDMTNPGSCGHVASHSYCWDCKSGEVTEEEQGQ